MSNAKKEFRCDVCKALLAKYGVSTKGTIEIKCRRCKQITVLNLPEGVTKEDAQGQDHQSIIESSQ